MRLEQTWQEVSKTQPQVAGMLKNSIIKDRVAHAYLFDGEKGTGKKEVALFFAQSLLCEKLDEDADSCGTCSDCKRIRSGNHPDVHVVEPDGLSIKKEQIKHLQEEFSKKSVESKRKIYIINDSDKMSVQAANSLLKFLEEPSADTVALLLTRQLQRMLPTILSRCQVISFKPLSPERLKGKLVAQGIDLQKSLIISHLTQNLEEGLQLSSDEWFAQAQKIVVKLYEVLNENPMKALLYIHQDWILHFKDREQIDRGLDLLFLIYKDLLYIQLDKQDSIVYQSKVSELQSHALVLSQKRLAEQMGFILEAKRKLLSNTNPQLVMEQLVLNLQGGSSFV
jgi:DNA polymerase III subunit delta'